ncbi:MAG: hypothetical protein U9N14_06885, partial [Pseudomonadota bacterium]|nr:hypothetical protein [Pseudomonadota bacterium]
AIADEMIPVKRVILSTSGLAHFEHEGNVTGNATLDMSVRLDQVDDMLKSLVIFDSKGSLGGVSLPGREPLAQAFLDLPFSRNDLNHPVRLLNALQGSDVTVKGAETITGTLIRVVPETVQLPDKSGTITHNRVTLMTKGGLRQVVLEDLRALEFTAKKVREQIARALDAVFDNRSRDRREISIRLRGQDTRPVGLAYVLVAPLWKAAYRVVLPAEAEGASFLQGWAVLENMTGNDWKDIELTLISGNPVTFKQPLYTSYYVNRPELPVEVLGRVMPRTDTGAIGTLDEISRHTQAALEGGEMRRMTKSRSLAASAPTAQMAFGSIADMEIPAHARGGVAFNMAFAVGAQAATSEEATTQVIFRFPEKIDLPRGHSLMMPFVSRELPVEKIALYQPDTHPTHPLSAIRLKNEEGTGLPPGILTLYERSITTGGTDYVGDAELPVLPVGEDRLISYALDSKTKIDRETLTDKDIGAVTVSQGVMHLKIKHVSKTTYTVKAPAKEDRLVLIEHPRRKGWNLVSPDAKMVEIIASHYRIKLPVKAGGTAAIKVVMEKAGLEKIKIGSLNAKQLEAQVAALGEIEPKIRKAFAQMADLQRQISRFEEQIKKLQREHDGIYRDQQRTRDNLARVPHNSELYRRYLTKMGKQEDRLDAIAAERAHQEKARDGARQRLQDFIAGLKI